MTMGGHRGGGFFAELSPGGGSGEGGIPPGLILQKDGGKRHNPPGVAAAITSKQAKTHLPTHIGLQAQTCGLTRNSIVLLEQIRTLDKRRLREKAGRLSESDQRRVDQALGISVGLVSM